MNRTEAHLTLGSVACSRGLTVPDLREARESGIPEDGVFHTARATEVFLRSEAGASHIPNTPNHGACSGCCTTFGCPPIRIFQCHDTFVPTPRTRKRRSA